MILFNLFEKQYEQEKYIILQMGKNRSIIQEVTGNDFTIYIIDNVYLMNLDEMGCVL